MSGRSVLLIDTEPRTHNRYLALAIADALRRHPAVAKVVLASHGDAIRRVSDQRLDTLVAFGGAYHHTALLSRLCSLVDLSILWTTEDPYQLSDNVRTSSAFDIVFTNDKASVPAYGGRGHHLPLAASPFLHDFPPLGRDEDYLYDLLFIGTAWPNRVESLNAILSRLSDTRKVRLALPWNEFLGEPKLVRPDLILNWRCGARDFARFSNRSRVVLTLPRHFSASGDTQAVGSTPPPRLFETALAGGAQVMVSPEPETAEYFEPGREISICGSDAEAVETIEELLASPERRSEMVARARARAQREHLYDHRVARLLALALPQAGGQRAARVAAVKPRKTVLMVSHNRLGHRTGGGVEVYLEYLREALPDCDVVFFFPARQDGRDVVRVDGPDGTRILELPEIIDDSLSQTRVEGFFEKVLFEFRVDVVHFHHLLHLPLSLPLIAKACGVPTLWQLHDFYLICERYNLLTFGNRFCDVAHRGAGQCDPCLLELQRDPPGSKARRDGMAARIAGSLDAVVASTPFSGRYLGEFFPEIEPGRVHILELPALGRPDAGPAGRARDDAAELRVAVPGNFTVEKGGCEISQLIQLCRDLPVSFTILGRADPNLLTALGDYDPARVSFRNGYRHDQIAALLAGHDVSLHLSTWPETFMLSLTEAWQASLVPIVTDLGAPGERVTDGVDGLKVAPNEVAPVYAAISELCSDRALLARMREAVARKRFVTEAGHAAALAAVYDDLIGRRPVPHLASPDQTSGPYRLGLFEVGIRLNSSRWSDETILWDGQAEPPRRRSSPDASPDFKAALERGLRAAQARQVDVEGRLSAARRQLADADRRSRASSERQAGLERQLHEAQERLAETSPQLRTALRSAAALEEELRQSRQIGALTKRELQLAQARRAALETLQRELEIARDGLRRELGDARNRHAALARRQQAFEVVLTARTEQLRRAMLAGRVNARKAKYLGRKLARQRPWRRLPPRAKEHIALMLEVLETGLFDHDWYLERNPDVVADGGDPLDHFVLHGMAEGRDPGPCFSTALYLERSPDVAGSGTPAFLHFMRHGMAEGRSGLDLG